MFSKTKIIIRFINNYKRTFSSQINNTSLTYGCANIAKFSISKNISIVRTSRFQQFISKTIFTSSVNSVKLFQNTENQFAHSILVNDQSYSENLVKNIDIPCEVINKEEFCDLIENDWKKESLENIISAFKKATEYSKENKMLLSNCVFNNLVEALLMNCRKLSDEQISELLLCLKKWPEEDNTNCHNFGDVWSALDDMCLERYRKWSVNKMLYFIDHWYNLHLAKVSSYPAEALYMIGRKTKQLTPRQLIQTSFYLNVCRKKLHSMFDLECRFKQCIPELSIDEIAIVCMAFFKTETNIKDVQVLSEIVDRLLDEIDTIPEISLCAILKICNGSHHLALDLKMQRLLQELERQIDRVSVLCCVHIALLGSNIGVFNIRVLNKITQKMLDNIASARLKDLERLAFVLALFNIESDVAKNMFECILKELDSPERRQETELYRRSFACLLHYLAWKQMYPIHLIDRILSPDFLKTTYGNRGNYGREILFVDTCLDLDVPDFNGNRLSLRERETASKKYTRWFPRRGTNSPLTDKVLDQICEVAEDVQGGRQYVRGEHLLPHFERGDVVICNDENGNPVNIANGFTSFNLSDLKRPPKLDGSNYYWYAIVAGGWNMLTRNKNEPLGTLRMKIKQLETLGYYPVLVKWKEWLNFSSNEKKEYILRNTQRNGNIRASLN